MSNRYSRKFLAVFLLLSLPFSFPNRAQAVSTGIFAQSALIVDKNSGKVLFARNPRQIMPPASTAKLLSVLVALDEAPLDQAVQVRSAATMTQPSMIHLHVGESLYVKDLLKAILISSANDAAKALGSAPALSCTSHCPRRRIPRPFARCLQCRRFGTPRCGVRSRTHTCS